MKKKRLTEQVVVVTGASSRLGARSPAVPGSQKLSPRAGDWILRRMGWKSQHTDEPKPVDGPDNLFDTLPGDPGAHGRFDDRSRGSTVWTRLRLLVPKG